MCRLHGKCLCHLLPACVQYGLIGLCSYTIWDIPAFCPHHLGGRGKHTNTLCTSTRKNRQTDDVIAKSSTATLTRELKKQLWIEYRWQCRTVPSSLNIQITDVCMDTPNVMCDNSRKLAHQCRQSLESGSSVRKKRGALFPGTKPDYGLTWLLEGAEKGIDTQTPM